MQRLLVAALVLGFAFLNPPDANPQEKPAVSAEELAKKLSNPVASLISVPLQSNTDIGIGDFNGSRFTLNVQPVIPITLSPNVNLIARVIVPIVAQHDITAEATSQSGLGDIVASAFFSPSRSRNGLTWGIGPAFLIPAATDDFLGAGKLGVGPTGVILKQTGGWTMGALVNQLWSVAGDSTRSDLSQMFVQPFLSYNWKSGAGITMNAEIARNWEAATTTTFLNPVISGVTRVGGQTVSLAVGPRIPLTVPPGSKPAFGVRAAMTLVFPK